MLRTPKMMKQLVCLDSRSYTDYEIGTGGQSLLLDPENFLHMGTSEQRVLKSGFLVKKIFIGTRKFRKCVLFFKINGWAGMGRLFQSFIGHSSSSTFCEQYHGTLQSSARFSLSLNNCLTIMYR